MGAGNEDSSYMQECRLALAALSRVIATKLENLNAALHETYVTLSERARIAKKKR
jgi:hypothetical protein